MAEQNPPSWLQDGTHPASHDRVLLQALLPSPGVVGPTDLEVTAGAGMNLSVAEGDAFVLGTGARHGMYHVFNDAAVTVALSPGDANPRKDRVVALVHDDFVDSGGLNEWEVFVVEGTPGVSPSEPTLPDNCYELCMILVPASATNIGVSGTFDDRRTGAACLGSIIPLTAATISSTPGRNVGDIGVVSDLNQILLWDGAEWITPGVLPRYSLQYTVPSGTQQTGTNAVWPTGMTVDVEVPDWAVTARCYAKIGQAYAVTNPANVSVTLQLGSTVADQSRIRWDDTKVANDAAQDIVLSGDIDVSADAGTTKTFKVVANNVSGTGRLRVGDECKHFMEISFS